MAVPTIDQAFIEKFNADVHLSYQQEMSKLRGCVRTDADVKASKVRFQKLGPIVAGTKARQGEIPPSNPLSSYVEATMTDYYTLDYVDALDLTKLNIDIRANYVKIHSMAFARQTDDIIIGAMASGATQTYGSYTPGNNLDRNTILAWIEQLDVNEVPDDMQRYGLITPHAYNFMMTQKEFANSLYTGPDLPFVRKSEVRTWLGVHWIKSNRLPGRGTSTCKMYIWHYRAVGHGINEEISITWDWENERKAWSAAGSMSMGATVIDPNGLIEGHFDDTAAFPTPLDD